MPGTVIWPAEVYMYDLLSSAEARQYVAKKNAGQKNGSAEEGTYDKINLEILQSLRIKLIFKR